MDDEQVVRTWNKGNEQGDGYAYSHECEDFSFSDLVGAGEAWDSPVLGEIIHDTDQGYVVYSIVGSIDRMIVADANGAWGQLWIT
jgi:hypothetical protein